jgi:phosphohistidine swiveling domain-containing protein
LNGEFYIVQSRDITASAMISVQDAEVQSEWARILGCAVETRCDAIAFEQNELSEVLPRPTRLSLSLMESLWGSGGSVDLACRKIGIRYRVEEGSAPYLVTIFGELYVNKGEELARTPKLAAFAAWRLKKVARTIKGEFREKFLPQFLKEIALLEAINFKRLPTEDLLDAIERIRKNYVVSTSVTTSMINIVADYYLKQAKLKLTEAGIEPAHFLVRLGQTEFERTIIDARRCPPEKRGAMLFYGLGHRSHIDYELAEPRYSEKFADLVRILNMPIASARSARQLKAELAALIHDSQVIEMVIEACSFQTLKEDAKHESLRELAVLRRALQAVDDRFALDGAVYQLTFEEIATLANDNDVVAFRSVAIERRSRAAELASMGSLCPVLSVRQLESFASGHQLDDSEGLDGISGIRVSGSGFVEGRACVVTHDDDSAATIPGFEDGDIVISRMVPATWIPYFKRAGGFVSEVGGWLSHTAIVAREFNVPLIVQAKGLRFIETGQLIRLCPDGSIEIIQPAEAYLAAE